MRVSAVVAEISLDQEMPKTRLSFSDKNFRLKLYIAVASGCPSISDYHPSYELRRQGRTIFVEGVVPLRNGVEQQADRYSLP